MPIFFDKIFGAEEGLYPQWRYHKYYEPKLVYNTQEAADAEAAGWKYRNTAPFTPPKFKNFGMDFEDLNERQLINFAKCNFDIDLSNCQDKERLIRAINQLYLNAPAARDDVVLLCQSMEMEYDQFVEQIKKDVVNASEVTREVFYA